MRLLCLTDSVLDHRSLPSVFEYRRGYIWRLFHLCVHFITFEGRSVHLAYHVHKCGHKTSTLIIIIISDTYLGFSYAITYLFWSISFLCDNLKRKMYISYYNNPILSYRVPIFRLQSHDNCLFNVTMTNLWKMFRKDLEASILFISLNLPLKLNSSRGLLFW